MLEQFLHTSGNGVYYIGHASALVRMNKFHLLLDPVWNSKPYGDYWTFVPPQIDCDRVLQITDGVIVSHIHEDHLCDDILRRAEGAMLYAMGGRPRLRSRLLKSGLRLREIIPMFWQTLIPGAIDVYFVHHPFNGIDSSCFLRNQLDGYTVYHGNDNFLSSELIESVRKNVDRVDVAMVPYGFVHWYPQCMDLPAEQKTAEHERLNKQSIMQAKEFIEAFKPEITIPFGNNIFYDDGPNHPLNKMLSTPYMLDEALPLLAGDYVCEKKLVRVLQDDPEFQEMKAHYLTRRQPPMDFNISANEFAATSVLRRVEAAQFRIPNHVLVVNDLHIDLATLTVQINAPQIPEKFYTKFSLSREIFALWISGVISFEYALGTRRFLCRREPNIYNQKVFEWMNQFL